MKTLLQFLYSGLLLFVLLPVSAQVNDSCAHAFLLQVNTWCSMDTFSNAGATAESGMAPNPNCGFYKGGDVWFKAAVPASGNIRYEVQGLSGITPQTAIYRGSCGAMTQLSCLQLHYHKTISDTSLAGDTLYFRVYNYNSVNGGSFRLCIWEPPVPANNACTNAIPLNVDTVCTLSGYTNAYATAEPSSVAPNPSCGFYQGCDVWYSATMPPSGAFRVESTTTNAQVAIYVGSCGSMAQILCKQLDPDRTIHEPSLAGQPLYIRVYSYNSDDGAPFSICLWEPPVPSNNYCADAITLPVKGSCSFSSGNNAYATAEATTVAPNPSCGFYKGGDVWFKAFMPNTGKMIIHRDNISGVNAQIAAYTGSCGSFSQIGCAQLNSTLSLNNQMLAGTYVYIRIYNYNSEEGGQFSICTYDTTCNNVDTGYIFDSVDYGSTYVLPDTSILTNIKQNIVDTSVMKTTLFCDSLVITHLYVRPPDTLINGYVRYLNSIFTPLCCVKVYLKSAMGVVIDSTISDIDGSFIFYGLFSGSYSLSAYTTKPPGGLNSADALLAQRYFTGLITLTGLKLKAADANNSNFVNSTDALLIQRRFVNLITAFDAGDWIFETVSLDAGGGGNQTINLYGICKGDVNGSYIPQ